MTISLLLHNVATIIDLNPVTIKPHIVFDIRVLNHQQYTGVENYTSSLLEAFTNRLHVNVAKPPSTNKYFGHLWAHLVLPFQRGNLLFCPANIAPLFVPTRKKLVITLHDVAFLTFPESFSPLFRWYYRFVVPRNLHRADKIITVSETSKYEILRHYPFAKEKIDVIALGLSDNFRVLPNVTKEKLILYVGSLNPRKNFASVIRAFLHVQPEGYKLVLAGSFSSNFTLDEETRLLLNAAKSNADIEIVSHLSNEELAQLYNRAEVLLFPSFYEGFGLPPLEAMACGTPVITSNCSCLPEVCGDTALYCDPHSVNDIAEKLNRLLNDKSLQNSLREKGLLHVKQFTWKKAAQQHVQIFKSLIS